MLHSISLLCAQHLQWSDLQIITKLQNLHSSHSGIRGAKVDANHLLTRGHFCAGSNLNRLICNDLQLPRNEILAMPLESNSFTQIQDCASMSSPSWKMYTCQKDENSMEEKHPTLDARPFLRVEAATAPAAVIAAAPTVKALLPQPNATYSLAPKRPGLKSSCKPIVQMHQSVVIICNMQREGMVPLWPVSTLAAWTACNDFLWKSQGNSRRFYRNQPSLCTFWPQHGWVGSLLRHCHKAQPKSQPGLFHPGFFLEPKLPTQNQQLITQGKGALKQAFQETLPSQRRPQLLLACFWKPSCKAVYRTKQDRNATWIYKTCLEIGPKNKGCARICLMLAV